VVAPDACVFISVMRQADRQILVPHPAPYNQPPNIT